MAQLTQLPEVVDLAFVAGDTFRIRVRVLDPDIGEPIALADYTFGAWIADAYGAAKKIEFVGTPDPDSPADSMILTLTSEKTAELIGTGNEYKGVWDLEVIFPNDDVRTVAKGSVTCVLDITNTGSGGP